MIRSHSTKSSELGASQAVAGAWQPMAGFTWELFLIAFAWVISFLTIPLTLLWMKQGASLSTLFWIAFGGYFGLTYKVTAWLSDRYPERQRKNLLAAEDLLKHDTRPHVLYLQSFKDDQTTSRLLNLSTEEKFMRNEDRPNYLGYLARAESVEVLGRHNTDEESYYAAGKRVVRSF